MKTNILLTLALALVINGCASRPTENVDPEKEIIPPKPSGEQLKGHIGVAREELKGVQGDIAEAKEEATKAGAPAVIPPLERASGHAVKADTRLQASENEIQRLSDVIKARDEAQSQTITRHQKELGEKDKSIKALEKKIDDLKNEELRTAKKIMSWAGGLSMSAGIVMLVLVFTSGFSPGLKFGPIFFIIGGIAVAVASKLTQIVFWINIGLLVVGVGFGVWLVWSIYHHIPPAKLKKLMQSAPAS